MSNQPCPRCGNQNPADIHTCAPLALKLADALENWPDIRVDLKASAAELRRLHAENSQWQSVFGHLGTPDEIGNEWIALQDKQARDEALLRQALEALEMHVPHYIVRSEYPPIVALRTALAEQPAEPVAIVTALSVHADGVVRASLNCELPLMMELYAAPQPTKQPLTDEEIDALELPPSGTATVRDLVRLIERAHGIGEQE